MGSIRDIAIEYGQQVEGLLEQLGARGPARGAGELLDQVKEQLDEHALRTIRRFLRLRNKVVHNKPVEMPMPSREEVERAGRAAVAVLEEVVAARARQANATFHPPQQNEMAKGLSWRVVFLPELALFAFAAVVVDPKMWYVVGVLLLRFFALFGDDRPLWKRWTLLVVGGLELVVAWAGLGGDFLQLAILIPGLLSVFRGIRAFFPRRPSPRPFGTPSSRNRVR